MHIRTLAGAVLWLGLAAVASAQVATTGTVQVVVSDPDGGRLPGVTVTAEAPDTITRRPDTLAVSAPTPGIWISREELMKQPTSGSQWDLVRSDAARDPGAANIADQNSNHDVYTLAAALVCVRTGELCAKARQGVVSAIGTDAGTRWLSVGRNLGAYVIAADLLNLLLVQSPRAARSLTLDEPGQTLAFVAVHPVLHRTWSVTQQPRHLRAC